MHNEILTTDQQILLPLLRAFSNDFILVGGTAIALHIGHRQSIDFDLFSKSEIKRQSIKNTIAANGFAPEQILYEAFDQLHIVINSVKLTFFNFPFEVNPSIKFEDIISIPSLLDLAAMKAYALGGRAKWKDYVDLFFIFKYSFSLQEVASRAKIIFENYYNEKLFREQLSYFEDIDYTEKVNFVDQQYEIAEIKEFLKSIAVQKL